MTKEEAIKHLKLMQSGARNAIRFKKNDKKISEEERKEDIEIYQDQLEALKIGTKALEQQPSDGCVSMGVYKQVAWERDIAIEQLKELGYSFGEKIRTSEDCVSRAEVLAIANDSCLDLDSYEDTKEFCDEIKDLLPVTPTHEEAIQLRNKVLKEKGGD